MDIYTIRTEESRWGLLRGYKTVTGALFFRNELPLNDDETVISPCLKLQFKALNQNCFRFADAAQTGDACARSTRWETPPPEGFGIFGWTHREQTTESFNSAALIISGTCVLSKCWPEDQTHHYWLSFSLPSYKALLPYSSSLNTPKDVQRSRHFWERLASFSQLLSLVWHVKYRWLWGCHPSFYRPCYEPLMNKWYEQLFINPSHLNAGRITVEMTWILRQKEREQLLTKHTPFQHSVDRSPLRVQAFLSPLLTKTEVRVRKSTTWRFPANAFRQKATCSCEQASITMCVSGFCKPASTEVVAPHIAIN